MIICKIHVPGDCAGDCSEPATGAPTRCHCGTVCGNPSCFEPATGAGLPKLGDDLESFVVMCLSHLLDDGDDKTARELVEMAAKELKAGYDAGRRAALEEAATKIRERIHDFPKVYQMSDCLVDILNMMKGGEDDG